MTHVILFRLTPEAQLAAVRAGSDASSYRPRIVAAPAAVHRIIDEVPRECVVLGDDGSLLVGRPRKALKGVNRPPERATELLPFCVDAPPPEDDRECVQLVLDLLRRETEAAEAEAIATLTAVQAGRDKRVEAIREFVSRQITLRPPDPDYEALLHHRELPGGAWYSPIAPHCHRAMPDFDGVASPMLEAHIQHRREVLRRRATWHFRLLSWLGLEPDDGSAR